MTNSVGVIRAPGGFQIEVLPKIGKVAADGGSSARSLLLDMLSCLGECRHIRKDQAELQARRMPLFEIFVSQFLEGVRKVLQRELGSGYNPLEDNLASLRGRLLCSENLKRNLVRPDRFFAAFDEFTQNRPENRLIHSALAAVADQTRSPANHRLAQELRFAFAEVPRSADIDRDFAGIARQRGMDHYEEPLAWARLLRLHDVNFSVTFKRSVDEVVEPALRQFPTFFFGQPLRRSSPSGLKPKAVVRRERHFDDKLMSFARADGYGNARLAQGVVETGSIGSGYLHATPRLQSHKMATIETSCQREEIRIRTPLQVHCTAR